MQHFRIYKLTMIFQQAQHVTQIIISIMVEIKELLDQTLKYCELFGSLAARLKRAKRRLALLLSSTVAAHLQHTSSTCTGVLQQSSFRAECVPPTAAHNQH